MEVRATAGDNFLGGEDFDDVIATWFASAAGIPLPDPLEPGPTGELLAARLRRSVEAARRRLSTAAEAEVVLPLPDAQGTVRAVLTTAEFARVGEPLLERLRRPVARALADSRIRPEALSHVVLAGGATRMPLVRREAARLFGRLPLQRLDPDEVVARGAAVQAGLKWPCRRPGGRGADGRRPLHAGHRGVRRARQRAGPYAAGDRAQHRHSRQPSARGGAGRRLPARRHRAGVPGRGPAGARQHLLGRVRPAAGPPPPDRTGHRRPLHLRRERHPGGVRPRRSRRCHQPHRHPQRSRYALARAGGGAPGRPGRAEAAPARGGGQPPAAGARRAAVRSGPGPHPHRAGRRHWCL